MLSSFSDLTGKVRNFERANFRECLKKSLTMRGFEFNEVCFAHNNPEDFAAKEELKAATNEVKDQNAQDIFNASDRFVGKPDKSTLDADWPTRCEIEKARLLDLGYPVEILFRPSELSGENILPNFVLNIAWLWQ